MKKTIIALAILLSSSVAVASDENYEREIHGRHFKGDIRVHKDEHKKAHNEHEHEHEHTAVVPLPTSAWLMLSGMFCFLGVARRSKPL